MGWVATWRARVRALKREALALALACRDPRVPWLPRLIAAGVVAYLFSPLDLIPDFIPVLGYLDDLVLVPLGIALVLALIPAEVMADCRRRADALLDAPRPAHWPAAIAIVTVWLAAAAAIALWLVRWAGRASG